MRTNDLMHSPMYQFIYFKVKNDLMLNSNCNKYNILGIYTVYIL